MNFPNVLVGLSDHEGFSKCWEEFSEGAWPLSRGREFQRVAATAAALKDWFHTNAEGVLSDTCNRASLANQSCQVGVHGRGDLTGKLVPSYYTNILYIYYILYIDTHTLIVTLRTLPRSKLAASARPWATVPCADKALCSTSPSRQDYGAEFHSLGLWVCMCVCVWGTSLTLPSKYLNTCWLLALMPTTQHMLCSHNIPF